MIPYGEFCLQCCEFFHCHFPVLIRARFVVRLAPLGFLVDVSEVEVNEQNKIFMNFSG